MGNERPTRPSPPQPRPKADTNPAMAAPPGPGSVRPPQLRFDEAPPPPSAPPSSGVPSSGVQSSGPGSEPPFPLTSKASVQAKRETPTEREIVPPSLGTPGRRSENPTVPGGGSNRMSGGRAAARAYVGVKTVAPGQDQKHTAAIKIDPRVHREGQGHMTEPALRQASSMPPMPDSSRPSVVPGRSRQVVLLIGGLALAVGALGAIVIQRSAHGGEEATWDDGVDGHPGMLDEPKDHELQRGALANETSAAKKTDGVKAEVDERSGPDLEPGASISATDGAKVPRPEENGTSTKKTGNSAPTRPKQPSMTKKQGSPKGVSGSEAPAETPRTPKPIPSPHGDEPWLE